MPRVPVPTTWEQTTLLPASYVVIQAQLVLDGGGGTMTPSLTVYEGLDWDLRSCRVLAPVRVPSVPTEWYEELHELEHATRIALPPF